MELQMSFRHMESTPSIKAVCEEKSEKLKKLFDGKIHVTWTFSVEKLDQIAHVHVLGSHMDYFGEAKSDDLYHSIDLALDKVERQIRKKKEILTNKLHHHA
jgi:putative sigma-54 modulation protein